MQSINTKDHMCFACSPHNPIGLKLKFKQEGKKVYTTFNPGEEHQGYNGFMHGGLISTLLDETMAQWLWLKEIPAMTAEITLRYSKPVPIDQELRVEAACISEYRGKVYDMQADLILSRDNSVAVKAKAKFMPVDFDKIG
ncbi:MAG: PaaI family thioesterase [Clostridiales bacterium]|nr:PaaI family thioesterase [Clostridiales bacterium]MCF8021621.1 PaaI family thioesterase [Clostridiales bacterium]